MRILFKAHSTAAWSDTIQLERNVTGRDQQDKVVTFGCEGHVLVSPDRRSTCSIGMPPLAAAHFLKLICTVTSFIKEIKDKNMCPSDHPVRSLRCDLNVISIGFPNCSRQI